MSKLSTDLNFLVENIPHANTKNYLRDTLAARLMEQGHAPAAVTDELEKFFNKTVH